LQKNLLKKKILRVKVLHKLSFGKFLSLSRGWLQIGQQLLNDLLFSLDLKSLSLNIIRVIKYEKIKNTIITK